MIGAAILLPLGLFLLAFGSDRNQARNIARYRHPVDRERILRYGRRARAAGWFCLGAAAALGILAIL